MAAQGVRRARLKSQACRRAALAGVLLACGAARAQDTTFLTTEELATRLRQDLAWISAQDIGEHGFGLVVGGDADRLWIVTARHVVVRTPMRGDPSSEQASRSIRVRLCAGLPSAEPVNAEPWPAWNAGGEDIAVLTVARPPGYQIAPRALAAGATAGEDVRLLGSRDECALAPEQGRVRATSGSAVDLRIDFAGVQGGSSGAPVLGGAGIVGLMISAEDLTTTVHAIGDLQRRAQSHAGFRWELVDARNIPPTDPRAAAVDLPETLNEYQLALRNMHMLLQQRQIPRPRLDEFMKRYNTSLGRFLRVRETYDGSLATHWPAPVLPAWRALRDELWSVHQTFWRLNVQMEEIYHSQHGSPELGAQMIALEPELLRLEVEIAQFLRLLAKET